MPVNIQWLSALTNPIGLFLACSLLYSECVVLPHPQALTLLICTHATLLGVC